MEVSVGTAVSSSAQGAGAARPTSPSTPGTSSKKVTAKTSADDEKKLPQKSKQLPQKPEVESGFAVTFAGNFAGTDLIDDEDLDDDDLDFYAKVDSNVWRVETRTYTKQDGTTMLYFNYRRRQSYVKKGKRIIPYKKGGKRVLDNGKK